MNSVAILVEPHILSCWGKVQAWEGTGNGVVLTCGPFPVWREDVPRPEVLRRAINIWGEELCALAQPHCRMMCTPSPHTKYESSCNQNDRQPDASGTVAIPVGGQHSCEDRDGGSPPELHGQLTHSRAGLYPRNQCL